MENKIERTLAKIAGWEKAKAEEAIIMWRGVRYDPPLEQEQEGTEDSEEQEDTEDSEQEGTVSVGEGIESD